MSSNNKRKGTSHPSPWIDSSHRGAIVFSRSKKGNMMLTFYGANPTGLSEPIYQLLLSAQEEAWMRATMANCHRNQERVMGLAPIVNGRPDRRNRNQLIKSITPYPEPVQTELVEEEKDDKTAGPEPAPQKED